MNSISEYVGCYLETDLGFPLHSMPPKGVEVRASPRRRDQEDARMLIVRIDQGALATGIPRVITTITPVVHQLGIWELFSPFGLAELSRALASEHIEVKGGGFHYTLTDKQYCPLQTLSEKPIKLLLEGMLPEKELFDKKRFDAFAIYQEGRQAALSQVSWKTEKFIEISVETHEAFRQRGYGLAVVAAAVEWILAQGAVAHYATLPSNIPSVRIARKLGFTLTWQEIYA